LSRSVRRNCLYARRHRLQEPSLHVASRGTDSPCGKIDDWRSPGPGRRETPAQLPQLDPVLPPPKDGSSLGGPDIIARLEIRCRHVEYDGVRIWLKAFQRGAIWYFVAEIVAHDQTLLVCAGARRLAGIIHDGGGFGLADVA
jgi:hypothetical protein